MFTSRTLKLAYSFLSAMAFTINVKAVVTFGPGDCERINQAIQQFGAKGAPLVIQLEKGTYECASPIIIDKNDVSLMGAGPGKTLVKPKKGLIMPVVIIGDVKTVEMIHWNPYPGIEVQNITLSGMTIDGDKDSHPDPISKECYNARTSESTLCGSDPGYYIRNNSLTIRRAKNILVTDLETSGAFSGGIVLEKICSNIHMSRVSSHHNTFDGMAGYETTASTFEDMSMTENGYSGFSFDIKFEKNILRRVNLSDNGDRGLYSANVSGNSYEDVFTKDNRGECNLFFDGERDHKNNEALIPGTCDGNRINGLVSIGSKVGIRVKHQCKGMRVENAKIVQPQGAYVSYFEGSEVEHSNVTGALSEQMTSSLVDGTLLKLVQK